jgi:ubiquinone/menaquinone biosynthesis C-methylase UbiE
VRETDFITRKAFTEKDVIAFYEEYASTWDDRFDKNYATHYFLERRWKSFVHAVNENNVCNKKAVELGVGTGVYIQKASRLFESIIALDGSQTMINILRNRVKKYNITNVYIMHANVVNLHVIDTAYADCVYFFGLIEHVIDTSSFLTEIKRVLKKGGVVIGVTPNKSSPWYKLRSIIRQTGKHCSSDKYYSMDELDKLFEANEFYKVYARYWGAVPAGINDYLAKFLLKIEPYLENTFMRSFLGGITFSYRR